MTSLEVYRLYDRANGDLQEGSHQEAPPRTAAGSASLPVVSTANPHLHRRPSNTGKWNGFSLLCSHCSFPLGPTAYSVLFVPSKSEVTVSPTSVEVLQSNPAGLQSPIPLIFLASLLDLQAGNLDMGLRTFTTVREFLVLLFSSLWVTHPSGMKFDLSWLHLSYLLIAVSPLSLDMGYIFSWVPVSSCEWLFNS